MKHLFRKSYFIAYETSDGSKASLAIYTSLFDDPIAVYDFACDYIRDSLDDDSVSFAITAMNRIK